MAPADPRTAHPVAPGTAGHALPRLVIAAAASSAGKTTVTTGLLAALTSAWSCARSTTAWKTASAPMCSSAGWRFY